MTADSGLQRYVSRTLSTELGEAGFALAGSGAIREHGLIDRPTEDIDLFTVMAQKPNFPLAVDVAKNRLESLGFEVGFDGERPRTGEFARLHASRGDDSIEIDMGIDYRMHEPVWVDGAGWVLDPEDAVGNKIDALYSRGEARDYLDALAIRRSGRWTDEQLMTLAADHDPGFDRTVFAKILKDMGSLEPYKFDAYVTRKELTMLVGEAGTWAERLNGTTRSDDAAGSDASGHAGMVHVTAHDRDGHRVREYWRRPPSE